MYWRVMGWVASTSPVPCHLGKSFLGAASIIRINSLESVLVTGSATARRLKSWPLASHNGSSLRTFPAKISMPVVVMSMAAMAGPRAAFLSSTACQTATCCFEAAVTPRRKWSTRFARPSTPVSSAPIRPVPRSRRSPTSAKRPGVMLRERIPRSICTTLRKSEADLSASVAGRKQAHPRSHSTASSTTPFTVMMAPNLSTPVVAWPNPMTRRQKLSRHSRAALTCPKNTSPKVSSVTVFPSRLTSHSTSIFSRSKWTSMTAWLST